MNPHSLSFKIRLGLFITIGSAIFVIGIFLIGKQKNLFDDVFKLNTTFFNVSGLQIGSNVRFSGINVGTVDNIHIINDTTVQVDMLIKTEVQQFIKTDCEANIGSSGIIGDKLLIISQGSNNVSFVKDGQQIVSKEPIETDAIIASFKVTADNAEIVTDQLAHIMTNINQGNGMLGRLIKDSTMAESVNQTLWNLSKITKGVKKFFKK